MRTAVFCALGLLLYTFLVAWVMSRIRYYITPRHLQVKLFGVRLRQIPLAEIEWVSKRRPEGWSEQWFNTLRPSHRLLTIRRSRGLRKNFVISPRNRYVFKTDLERAVQNLQAPPHQQQDLFIISE